ncbi:response regulator [Rhizobium sp. P32RR-XVIII]|uniref:response regulator n=1 Tax=Rhizobium sp. P32RR-XVIII TaxID=2726738 RepID=UPI001456A197|nr:response regulator [Rhizobium sp. P32RR-XVIII]NLS08324.1 response regulator [Rhizobium sp. P32RR-XVIII]
MTAAPAVLVVEDEAFLRLDIVDSLNEDGFHVLEAGDAYEAIATLESRQPIDLVFTDVEMPSELDGLALAKLVAERWPSTRIIVTSGRRAVEITDIPDGTVFFSKPYRHVEIIMSMREMLASAGKQP